MASWLSVRMLFLIALSAQATSSSGRLSAQVLLGGIEDRVEAGGGLSRPVPWALLNVGSEMRGGKELVLPSTALTELLQERSRPVYVTGVRDMPNKRTDEASRASAESRFICHLHTLSMPGVEPCVPRSVAFSKAMALLDADPAPDAELSNCRERIIADIRTEMDKVERLYGKERPSTRASCWVKWMRSGAGWPRRAA